MSDHTPGPWQLSSSSLHVFNPRIEVHRMIAECSGEFQFSSISLDERRANAHLIAKAPELLAACEAARAHLDVEHGEDCCVPVIQQLRDLLAELDSTAPKSEAKP